jgi:hypothetical protein
MIQSALATGTNSLGYRLLSRDIPRPRIDLSSLACALWNELRQEHPTETDYVTASALALAQAVVQRAQPQAAPAMLMSAWYTLLQRGYVVAAEEGRG